MAISHSKAEQREKKEAEMSFKRELKRKKEEERLRLQSEKARNQKLQSENFLKFFIKPSGTKANSSTGKRQHAGWIPTFPIQPGMTIAKTPPLLLDKNKFDSVLTVQEDNFVSSYITECKGKEKTKRKIIPCSPVNQQCDDDIIILDEKDYKVKRRQEVKYKLLQFCDNHRPAYYGTWQKISKIVRPRNPFTKDESLLDYSVDSDDEWEEDEPGESLSDCSVDDGEDMDDEDEDDGFFVPHGYLSDGEGELNDSDTAVPKESKEEKMKMKEKAWEIEFTRKCQPLKPICIGCCWASNGTETIRNALMQYQAVVFTSLPVTINVDQQQNTSPNLKTTPKMDRPNISMKSSSPQSNICYKRPVPEEAMPDLIQILQGNSVGLDRAVKKFRDHWGRKMAAGKSSSSDAIQSACYSEGKYEQISGISKRQVEKKIHEIAKKIDRVWQVDKSVLQKYSVLSNSKLDLYSKVDISSHDHSPIQLHPLKENFTKLNEKKVDIIDKQDDCHSPAIKRLKLTETQSPSLVVT